MSLFMLACAHLVLCVATLQHVPIVTHFCVILDYFACGDDSISHCASSDMHVFISSHAWETLFEMRRTSVQYHFSLLQAPLFTLYLFVSNFVWLLPAQDRLCLLGDGENNYQKHGSWNSAKPLLKILNMDVVDLHLKSDLTPQSFPGKFAWDMFVLCEN